MKLKWKKDAKNTYILINMTAGFKKGLLHEQKMQTPLRNSKFLI